MLKLYLYGYLNKIQSGRRFERETNRNVELMRLLNRLMSGFETIADFRKDNGPAIKKTCRQFIMICIQLNLFAESLAVIQRTCNCQTAFKCVHHQRVNNGQF